MTALFYTLFDTELGTCGLAWSEAGLCKVQLPEKTRELTRERLAMDGAVERTRLLPPEIAEAVSLLTEYAEGKPVDFSGLRLDFAGIERFEHAVYDALRRVERGRTVTYGELAGLAGWPAGAAQSVGRAMARNPWPVVVPCHRVLAAGNKPGGFSAPGGLRTKEKLLEMEGVYLDGGMPMLPGLF